MGLCFGGTEIWVIRYSKMERTLLVCCVGGCAWIFKDRPEAGNGADIWCWRWNRTNNSNTSFRVYTCNQGDRCWSVSSWLLRLTRFIILRNRLLRSTLLFEQAHLRACCSCGTTLAYIVPKNSSYTVQLLCSS